jgi:hypothetical protein
MRGFETMRNFRKKVIIFFYFFILIKITVFPIFASEPEKIIQGRQLFYQSVENSKTIDKAINLFNEIGKNKEYEGLALTYTGALTALKGKFAFFPFTKVRRVKEGLTLMDQGILLDPKNIESRFIRGMTCYYLPFFFKRKKTAQNDFRIIVQQLQTDYPKYEAQMVLNITNFLSENVELNPEEKEIIENIQNIVKSNEG